MDEPTKYETVGRMLPCICRNHKKNADLMLERSGLYQGQAKLLMILYREDGISHSKVASELRISPAAASKVIKRMEQDGYVSRMTDGADERVSRVFLQPKGQILANKIHAIFQQLDQSMLEGFSDREIQELYGFLERVLKNLQENLSRFEEGKTA
ncbi:MAG: MarR family transcriptional regulator [Pelolinea sp.]|jgi:DNA-binding MarR family transcriptional regulator|nr:MarR family transcriptional regulator [Pelolinea sp.]